MFLGEVQPGQFVVCYVLAPPPSKWEETWHRAEQERGLEPGHDHVEDLWRACRVKTNEKL
jgi:hypothetical protein